MYIFDVVLSIVFLFILVKTDKYLTKKNDGDMGEDDEIDDLWIGSFGGRKRIYLILLFTSLIPYVNCLQVWLSLLAWCILLGIMFTHSAFVKNIADKIKKLF